MLRVGHGSVLVAALTRCEDPQRVDPKCSAEREVDQRDDSEDDREDSSPGLPREQRPAREKDAPDADHEGEECHGPQAIQPHSAKRAPAEVEVGVTEVAAEEAVEEQYADHSGEGSQYGVDEPKGREALKIAGHTVVG